MTESMHNEEISQIESEGNKVPGTNRIGDYAANGAMVSAFIAALAVLLYLFSTIVGIYGIGDRLITFIFGIEHGLGELAMESFFVVITRFLVIFCILWWPITAMIAKGKTN